MKLIKYCTYFICMLFVVSCEKTLEIPQAEIYGIYEPVVNLSLLKQRIEIKADQTLIWDNSQGFSSSKKYTYTYEMNENLLSIFQDGSNKAFRQLNLTKDKESNIHFANMDLVMNLQGEMVPTTTIYQRK